jgi:hypothetical protein
MLSVGSFRVWLCSLAESYERDEAGRRFLQNIGNFQPAYTVSHSRRWYSSCPLSWEPQISQPYMSFHLHQSSCAIAQAVSHRFPTAVEQVQAQSGHVDKVVLRQVFCKYFAFPCWKPFHQMLHTHLPSRAGIITPLGAGIPRGLSHPTKLKKKKNISHVLCSLFSFQTVHRWALAPCCSGSQGIA